MQNNKESSDSLFFITKNIPKKKITKTKNYFVKTPTISKCCVL